MSRGRHDSRPSSGPAEAMTRRVLYTAGGNSFGTGFSKKVLVVRHGAGPHKFLLQPRRTPPRLPPAARETAFPSPFPCHVFAWARPSCILAKENLLGGAGLRNPRCRLSVLGRFPTTESKFPFLFFRVTRRWQLEVGRYRLPSWWPREGRMACNLALVAKRTKAEDFLAFSVVMCNRIGNGGALFLRHD